MKISHEIVDNDHFLDIILSAKEVERIADNVLVTGVTTIFGKIVYVGIGLSLDMEDDYATSEE